MCTLCAATTLCPHCRPHGSRGREGRGVVVVSSEDGKGGSIWMWAKANTQNTQHTQAKSLCDHSNEAESAEHLAKPQQHFTIASLQRCVWVWVCVCMYVHLCVCVHRLEQNVCQPATTSSDKVSEIAMIAYENERIALQSQNSVGTG